MQLKWQEPYENNADLERYLRRVFKAPRFLHRRKVWVVKPKRIPRKCLGRKMKVSGPFPAVWGEVSVRKVYPMQGET